jgi:hypothetical protein
MGGSGKGRLFISMNMIGTYYYSSNFLLLLDLYRWESILAVRCPPKTQNNVVKYYVLQFTCKI